MITIPQAAIFGPISLGVSEREANGAFDDISVPAVLVFFVLFIAIFSPGDEKIPDCVCKFFHNENPLRLS